MREVLPLEGFAYQRPFIEGQYVCFDRRDFHRLVPVMLAASGAGRWYQHPVLGAFAMGFLFTMPLQFFVRGFFDAVLSVILPLLLASIALRLLLAKRWNRLREKGRLTELLALPVSPLTLVGALIAPFDLAVWAMLGGVGIGAASALTTPNWGMALGSVPLLLFAAYRFFATHLHRASVAPQDIECISLRVVHALAVHRGPASRLLLDLLRPVLGVLIAPLFGFAVAGVLLAFSFWAETLNWDAIAAMLLLAAIILGLVAVTVMPLVGVFVANRAPRGVSGLSVDDLTALIVERAFEDS